MRLIHLLFVTIVFGGFAINAALAERPAPAKKPPIEGIAKKGIVARQLEQVRKGIPLNPLKPPGNGVAANSLERTKNGVSAAAMGHARNHQDSDAQSIGGPARNAIGFRVKNGPTAAGKSLGPAAIGAKSTSLASTRHPSPERAGIARVTAPAAGGMASVPAGNTAPAVVGYIHGSINGTGLGRIGSGPAVVGGPPAKSAGINGTNMRPKH